MIKRIIDIFGVSVKKVSDYQKVKKDIKDILVWDKGHGQPAMHENVTNSCYELILILEGDKKCGRMIQNGRFKSTDLLFRLGVR